MSEERFDRLESLILSIATRMDTMQQDIDRRFDIMQQDISAIRTRIDTEGTMSDAFERHFTQMMQQNNETSQLSRDTSRDLGTVEERMDRVERQQRRANIRLNDLEEGA